MSLSDTIVFGATLLAVIIYGLYRGRQQHSTEAYLRAGRSLSWPVVLLGIMATQASAITFLTAPGQAYTDGMRFVQYYFGLPIAMVVICAVFVPVFRRQNVFTAYEFLEQRFDRKTRVLTSTLFLLSRGVSTGISIYAPSIVISTILDWNIYLTNVVVGGALMVYTLRGGARSVAYTQTLMFGIIIVVMLICGVFVVMSLPEGFGLSDALLVAGKSGVLNVITTTIDLNDRYNLLSGIVGGGFLALSYFGTDQSQVGRFIAGKDESESKRGLLINGIVKIPMQFGILLLGALLVALYSFIPAPLFFNQTVANHVREREPLRYLTLQNEWNTTSHQLHEAATALVHETRNTGRAKQETIQLLHETRAQQKQIRNEFTEIAKKQGIAEHSDVNYVLLYFVRTYLPAGLVGLVFAIVIMASWGSISAAFHALATASLIDVQKVLSRTSPTSVRVEWARWHFLAWGAFCVAISMLATTMGSLIEAVNELGSLFYGPILGIFLVAFFLRKVTALAVFVATVAAEVLVFTCWITDAVSFLWLNVIGSLAVVGIAWFCHALRNIYLSRRSVA